MKLHVRPAFYEDIAREELWLLEHAGAEIADRWHESLWRTTQRLQTHPLMGRARTDLNHPAIRSWRVHGFNRWIIFYGVHDEALVLYRVVSGTMDLFALRFD